MKIVVFGLTISSSWGNGHATLWRGLCRALNRRGHRVVFYERDTDYYAATRDLQEPDGCKLLLYRSWSEIAAAAAVDVADADVALVTSFCPDALAASELLVEKASFTVFYDLDTPVTLSAIRRGSVPYIGTRGLRDFDLVLSYTGGAALDELTERLGARHVLPLYGHVDTALYRPVAPNESYRADLSYLGTYSADRQPTLERLFLQPARMQPERQFLIGGAQYPPDFPWAANINFARHVPPGEHPAFFSSSRLTLNVTRSAMAEMGWCPSGRLFEAAACGAPIISDAWSGLDDFFRPGSEILLADDYADIAAALDCDDAELRRIGNAARGRVFDEHTSDHRADAFLSALDMARPTAPRHALAGA